MQKILFGIFAHPDDEAFGPAGTLILETRAGTELHLITLTAGEGGMNPDEHKNLADVRLQEWQRAGQLLGASHMHHLGYVDGMLGNIDHLAITEKIMEIVEETARGRDDIAIEFMSIDLNGVTGHIDHIVAGRSACLAFCRLKSKGLPMSRVRLSCMSEEEAAPLLSMNDFCFMEPGHSLADIDETIDARSVVNEVLEVMHCHHTQRGDADFQINAIGDGVAINHFIVPEF